MTCQIFLRGHFVNNYVAYKVTFFSNKKKMISTILISEKWVILMKKYSNYFELHGPDSCWSKLSKM